MHSLQGGTPKERWQATLWGGGAGVAALSLVCNHVFGSEPGLLLAIQSQQLGMKSNP